MNLYNKLGKREKALEDIDCMLTINNISNTINIEKLLQTKIDILLKSTLDDDDGYNQIGECLKQLKLCNENNFTIFNKFPQLQERTRQLIMNKKYDYDSIEWCYLAAKSDIANRNNVNQYTQETTPEQKDLAHYLLTAAKIGNTDAQLILLAYKNNKR
jgi:hypothetical protein